MRLVLVTGIVRVDDVVLLVVDAFVFLVRVVVVPDSVVVDGTGYRIVVVWLDPTGNQRRRRLAENWRLPRPGPSRGSCRDVPSWHVVDRLF